MQWMVSNLDDINSLPDDWKDYLRAQCKAQLQLDRAVMDAIAAMDAEYKAIIG